MDQKRTPHDQRLTPLAPLRGDTDSMRCLGGEHLRLLFDNMLEGFAYCRMEYAHGVPVDFVYLDVNRAFEALTGLKDVVGKAVSVVIPGIRDLDPGLFEIYARVANGGAPERCEYFVESLASWYSISVFCPEIYYFVAVFDVITDRKEVERALRRSEERLRFALEGANDGLWDVNLKTDEAYISARGCEILGYTPDEVQHISRNWKNFVYENDMEITREKLLEYLQGHTKLFEVEQRLKMKSGALKWVLTRGKVTQYDAEGQPIRMTGTHTDITERKKAEDALKESEARYHLLVDNAADAIYLADCNGDFADVNAEVMVQTQYDRAELLRMNITDIDVESNPASLALVLKEIQAGHASTFQTRHKRKDGGIFPVELRVAPLELGGKPYVMGIARDVSERTNMQEALIQTEKMMSVGGLAAGMAHEINNPLSGILQSVQVIKKRLSESSDVNINAAQNAGCPFQSINNFLTDRDILLLLDNVQIAGFRAAKIVSNMLEFSRASESNHIAANVNALLDDTLELCATDYDLKKKFDFRKISIERDYASGLPEVPCSKSKMQQVVMNILTNAAYAMAGMPSPKITLRTGGEGDYIRIELEDNGPGMDEATRRKIFEPFFTTKPVGEGTGLGLSVSYFIVTQSHKGTIEVESASGMGTRFLIRLPVRAGERAKNESARSVSANTGAVA